MITSIACRLTETLLLQARGGFFFPWQFFVAFKSLKGSTIWLEEEAAVEYKIRSRILPTLDRDSSLRFFDGATMSSYFYPTKASQVVFCRGFWYLTSCLEGRGFDPNKKNLSECYKHAETGVATNDDIAQLFDEAVYRVSLSSSLCDLITKIKMKLEYSSLPSDEATESMEKTSVALGRSRRDIRQWPIDRVSWKRRMHSGVVLIGSII